MLRTGLFLALGLSLSLSLSATSNLRFTPDSSAIAVPDTTAYIREDDPVLQAMDAMWLENYLEYYQFETDSHCLNVHGFAPNEVPVVPNHIVAERLASLDEKTPFNLVYNDHVQAFINLYVNQRRELTSRILGLTQLYYPLFEEKLDQFDIPLEMKHLAVVESALNPKAKSRAGAMGLWQFMYGTGKMYGLQVNSYIDERCDPVSSTIAACRYFTFLYDMYGDWNLVLAAYNSGPGNVNKAIRRSGGKRDYWEIRRFLPRETAGYVPAFIAVNYVMNHAADHNLYPVKPSRIHAEVDTVKIYGKALRLENVWRYTSVSPEELAFLNPACKGDYVPQSEKPFTLYLPRTEVGTYLANEDSIFAAPVESKPELTETIAALASPRSQATVHTVKRGEVLGGIASRYRVSIADLRSWNNISGSRIYPGQKLNIHGGAVAANPTSEQKSASSGAAPSYHVVQPGDTLWDIANKYEGVSVNEIKSLNSGINYNRLKPGQKIRITAGS